MGAYAHGGRFQKRESQGLVGRAVCWRLAKTFVLQTYALAVWLRIQSAGHPLRDCCLKGELCASGFEVAELFVCFHAGRVRSRFTATAVGRRMGASP